MQFMIIKYKIKEFQMILKIIYNIQELMII